MKKILLIVVTLCFLPLELSISKAAPLQTQTITLQPGETFTSTDLDPITIVSGSLNLNAVFTAIAPPIDTSGPIINSFTIIQNGRHKNYTISTSVNDISGIQSVKFFVDNILKGIVTAIPYTITVNIKTGGTHTWMMQATDTLGNVSQVSIIR